MIARVGALSLVLLLAGCGGAPPPGQSPPAGTPGAGQPTAAGQPTPAVPIGDDVIDGAAVRAAMEALENRDSWTFDVTYFVRGLDTGVEQTVSGTERRTPARAVDARHAGPTGEFHYIRIDDTIWVDLGNGQYSEFEAGDSENLISQYEPLHLAGLMSGVTDSRGDYEFVGEEVVQGVATRHYRLSESDRENIVQLLDIEADAWAGDAWIATDGGHLLQFAWGPQNVEDATPLLGFLYEVTSVDCTCPVEPPD